MATRPAAARPCTDARRFLTWSLAALGCLLFATRATGEEEMVSQGRGFGVGKDPHGFVSAKEMYAVPALRAFDAAAADLLARVTVMLSKGGQPESDEAWEILRELSHYARTPQVQAAVPSWVKHAKSSLGTAKRDDGGAFDAGTAAYASKDFAAAMEQYRRALAANPKHAAARNNLALALLHRNMDLAAEIELELLLQIHPNYLPAMINLTVVDERLGQTARAVELARQAAAVKTDGLVPQAQYNAAWFLANGGDTPGAGAIMAQLTGTQLPGFEDVSAYPDLKKWAAQPFPPHAASGPRADSRPSESRQAPDARSTKLPFWRLGVFGLLGLGSSWMAIIGFAFVSFLIPRGFGKSLYFAASDNEGAWGFFLFGSACAALYLLLWGVPGGSWWVFFGYALLMAIIGAKSTHG